MSCSKRGVTCKLPYNLQAFCVCPRAPFAKHVALLCIHFSCKVLCCAASPQSHGSVFSQAIEMTLSNKCKAMASMQCTISKSATYEIPSRMYIVSICYTVHKTKSIIQIHMTYMFVCRCANAKCLVIQFIEHSPILYAIMSGTVFA